MNINIYRHRNNIKFCDLYISRMRPSGGVRLGTVCKSHFGVCHCRMKIYFGVKDANLVAKRMKSLKIAHVSLSPWT